MLTFSTPSPSRYRPDMSSPLAAQSSSPIATVQAKRSGQYKSRSRATRSSASLGTPQGAEATEKALLRERLLAKCAEQRQRDRARARARSWASSSDGEPSSDGDVPMDADYDDDDDDDDNEVLIGRIIASERRRTQHKFNHSFDYEVGSSPGISEDMLEEYFNTEVPPDEDNELAAMYEEYVATLQEISSSTPEQSDGDSAMSDDVPMTPERQIRRSTSYIPPPRRSNVLSRCPACSLDWSAQDLAAGSSTCPQCHLTLSLEAVTTAWHEEHELNADTSHRPVVATLPDGIILVCAANKCDWCCAL